MTAKALRITSAPTLSSAIHTARGTWRAASLVSSAVATHPSKPMNTQPPTAIAARNAAPVEPPDSASAPSVSVRIEKSCSRKASNRISPTPTEATPRRRCPP